MYKLCVVYIYCIVLFLMFRIVQVIGCQDGTIALYQMTFNTVHGLYQDRYAMHWVAQWLIICLPQSQYLTVFMHSFQSYFSTSLGMSYTILLSFQFTPVQICLSWQYDGRSGEAPHHQRQYQDKVQRSHQKDCHLQKQTSSELWLHNSVLPSLNWRHVGNAYFGWSQCPHQSH